MRITEISNNVVKTNTTEVLTMIASTNTNFETENDRGSCDHPPTMSNLVEDFLEEEMKCIIDEENAEGLIVKEFYESLLNSYGDCSLIYESNTFDTIEPTDFKKKHPPTGVLEFQTQDEETFIKVTVDLKRKILVINVEWLETSFDPKAIGYMRKSFVKKTQDYSIRSVDFYEVNNKIWEYVIFTTKGFVLHLWNMESTDENDINKILRFKDMVNQEYIDNLF